eukprot:CAMPEP_0184349958 /NCGR_PEP_ID=MMETSP1089-20130417/37382_1 /TAXON_ID=38269 ORGANISM="Gloeochaete wittrockiana, Strain SAG46.84" /NCGR_SAMPLE_ID=MMETSP1089 /ASSEMBLY_ACC=CAM_ASM_000445 /LENGTH=613 /DNA_ID=CAMNT_0026682489 /DNA_START=89 /DNA_END=1930 /DNA_ORIENTATION=-
MSPREKVVEQECTKCCTSRSSLQVDPTAIRSILDGNQAQIKNSVRNFIERRLEPIDTYELSHHEYRKEVFNWCKQIADARIFRLRDLKDNPEAFFAFMETIVYWDCSAAVKFAVQNSLFGGTVLKLGSDSHTKYIDAIEQITLPGCFAMTEIGHGSNVRGIETTADYDQSTKEFIINTPSEAAFKFWIGNSAVHGQMATVFAQLNLKGKALGVHAFLVAIRTPDGTVCKGVTIRDCGHKMGLNGVDNGALGFNHVRIPRENLLNRHSSVLEDGTYKCNFPNSSAHFAATIGELVAGRVVIGRFSTSVAKLGLTIAVRYAHSRRQFGPPGAEEVPLMYYKSHRRRLMPLLASAFVYDSLGKWAGAKFVDKTAHEQDVHAHAAGFKVMASEFCCEALQTCRECCGGQGYRSKNRLGMLKADSDIFMTFEGDNTVLLQQVTKFLLSEIQSQAKTNRFSGAVAYMAFKAPSSPAKANFSSAEWFRSAAGFRSCLLVKELARRMSALNRQGKGAFDSWNECLVLVLKVARAHMDYMAIANAYRGSEVFDACANLDALVRLEKDLAWLQARGFLSSEDVLQYEQAMTNLCDQLAEVSSVLVESFAIPKKCLPRADLTEY